MSVKGYNMTHYASKSISFSLGAGQELLLRATPGVIGSIIFLITYQFQCRIWYKFIQKSQNNERILVSQKLKLSYNYYTTL